MRIKYLIAVAGLVVGGLAAMMGAPRVAQADETGCSLLNTGRLCHRSSTCIKMGDDPCWSTLQIDYYYAVLPT
jgi:hypothetical protein